MPSKHLSAVLTAASILACSVPADAATKTWIGASPTTSNFSDAQNWQGAVAVASGDDVIFNAIAFRTNPVQDIDTAGITGGLILKTVTFAPGAGANPYTISSANVFPTLYLGVNGTNGITNSAAATETFSLPIQVFSTAQTWSVGSGGALNFASSVSLDTVPSLSLTGAGNFKFSGLTAVAGSTSNITLSTSGIVTFNGIVQNGGGTLGPITVSGGTTLSGTGQVNTLTTVSNNAILAPGDAGVGTFTLKSGLALNPNSILKFDLGTSSDLVAITSGSFTLGGILNVNNSGGLTSGTYNLFSYNGATLSGGSISTVNMPSGFTGNVINDTTNKVVRLQVVNAVPEPSTFAMLFGSAAAFAAFRRVSRKK